MGYNKQWTTPLISTLTSRKKHSSSPAGSRSWCCSRSCWDSAGVTLLFAQLHRQGCCPALSRISRETPCGEAFPGGSPTRYATMELHLLWLRCCPVPSSTFKIYTPPPGCGPRGIPHIVTNSSLSNPDRRSPGA